MNFTKQLLTPVYAMDKYMIFHKEEEKKSIYLTFDDGPSNKVTNNILDVLKEKNVKATFFVVGYKIEHRDDILKRIYNEGHSIGLHTYSHDYKKIYSNEEAFINEMKITADKIEDILKFRPNILRFPSGSKGYLSKSFMDKLHKNNFKIYDWNACLSDGINQKKSPDALYREAIKTGMKWHNVILLMHCDENNMNTCRALPSIIDYYKNLGYEFKIIDSNTKEYYFRVSKS